MPTKFAMTRDINGYNGFGLKFTDTAYSATLAINTDTSLTVPSINSMGGSNTQTNAQLIAIFFIDPSETVWVAVNTAAAAPAGAAFAATASEGNPAARNVSAGDVLHFFTATANVTVGVAFYWLT